MGLALELQTGYRAVDLQSTKVNTFQLMDVAVMANSSRPDCCGYRQRPDLTKIAQRAVAEMQEVDRLKSQFLANMSHEFVPR